MQESLSAQLEKIRRDGKITAQIDTYVTLGPGDATRFVYVYCDLHPAEEVCFVACGGNGTLNEVASGMVGFPNKSLAIISYGACNDFIKYYPQYDFTSVEAIFRGTPVDIDILKVNDNYAINVCNFGFDSVVCSTAINYASSKHLNPYYIGIAKALLTARFNRISVKVDGEKIGGRRMLLCALANAKYVGGEFNCAPMAKIDDGKIEVIFVPTMSLLTFFKMLPVYAAGKCQEHPTFSKKIIYRQAAHVEVASKRLIELCLDGEMLPGKTFSIDVLPNAIKLVLPATD